MPRTFDTDKGEFLESDSGRESRTRFVEVPVPNTILSGEESPSDSIGMDGDFYINTSELEIFYKSGDEWGDGISLIGETGAQGEVGEKGDTGDDGLSIVDVARKDNEFHITLSDGTVKRFDIAAPVNGVNGKDGRDGKNGADGAAGADGKDGRGIASIAQDKGNAVITYTDGATATLKLPVGKDGKSVEMGATSTHIQWRYVGEKDWHDLVRIPKARGATGGGGGASLDDLIGILVAGSNITITQTSGGKLTLASSGGGGGGIIWTEVTDTTQDASINSGYILNNASLVTLTLPATAAVGSVIGVVGEGAGGWKVAQNSGQLIHFSSQTTITGTDGGLESTNQWDCIELLCVTADTTWVVRSSVGNINVISGSYLLLENGDNILLENGTDKLTLE